MSNKLREGNRWFCPFCDYSNHIEDDLGVHMIANHDKELYEAGQ